MSKVLGALDLCWPFKLEVDASAIGAGAVLLQKDADTDDDLVFFAEM